MFIENALDNFDKNTSVYDNNKFIGTTPLVFIRHYDTIIKTGSNLEIPYYVTDYLQKEYLEDDYSETFTTIIKIGGVNGTDKYSRTTTAGEFKITIKASDMTTGINIFSIRTIDKNGVESIEQQFHFLVVDKLVSEYTASDYYTMTSDDLTAYGIVAGADATIAQAKANKGGFTSLFKAKADAGYRGIKLITNTYMIDYHNSAKVDATDTTEEIPAVENIKIPNNFTIDMNGSTFQATQCTDLESGVILYFNNNINSHILNGSIFGNLEGFDWAATRTALGKASNATICEGLIAIGFGGSIFCTYENVNTGKTLGYNMWSGPCSPNEFNKTGYNWGFTDNKYIDEDGVVQTTTKAYAVSDLRQVDTNINMAHNFLKDLQISSVGGANMYYRTIGYPIMYVFFYDEEQQLLGKIKTREYQRFVPPENTKYIRMYGEGTASHYTSSSYYMPHWWSKSSYCSYIGVNTINPYTCCIETTHVNCIWFKDCTVKGVQGGQTPYVFDFEDGWYNMMNIFIDGFKVLYDYDTAHNSVNGLCIVMVNNLTVENCRGLTMKMNHNSYGVYCHNNYCPQISWEIGNDLKAYGWNKVENNICNKILISGTQANGTKRMFRNIWLTTNSTDVKPAALASTTKFSRYLMSAQTFNTDADGNSAVKGLYLRNNGLYDWAMFRTSPPNSKISTETPIYYGLNILTLHTIYQIDAETGIVTTKTAATNGDCTHDTAVTPWNYLVNGCYTCRLDITGLAAPSQSAYRYVDLYQYKQDGTFISKLAVNCGNTATSGTIGNLISVPFTFNSEAYSFKIGFNSGIGKAVQLRIKPQETTDDGQTVITTYDIGVNNLIQD